MIVSNNLKLNTIDKTYNVFSNKIISIDEKNKETKIDDSVKNDINLKLNNINKEEKVSDNTDINALLASVKSNIENGDTASLFNSSDITNISDLLA